MSHRRRTVRRPLRVLRQTESALRVAKALKHAGCDSGWSTCRSTSRNRVTREQQEKGPDHPGARVAVKRQEQLGMSSPGEQKTFHKASRRGNSRAATGRGAGRACCGDSTSTGGVQDSTTTSSTRHADRSINSSMSASRSAR